MRFVLIVGLLVLTLQAQSFSQKRMYGVWQISSPKTNGIVSFGKDIGKERRNRWHLIFNKEGLLKVQETGSIYNYEVIDGALVIYETKVYRQGYKIKQKHRYDRMQIAGRIEGCLLVKTVTKKIVGIKKKGGFKMCKTEEFPQPMYQRNMSDYSF
ncbi:MAG: hypothetical protein KAI17_22165 [Thiotrichaceae bacterium]|nr:hypothetical protein [Thiotrichaceae bacterium]